MKQATTFNEAYLLLERAIQDQAAPRLRTLIDDEIQTFKTLILSEVDERKFELQKFGELGAAHVEELAHRIDAEVRQNPMLYVGGAAAAALALGLLLSRRQEVYA